MNKRRGIVTSIGAAVMLFLYLFVGATTASATPVAGSASADLHVTCIDGLPRLVGTYTIVGATATGVVLYIDPLEKALPGTSPGTYNINEPIALGPVLVVMTAVFNSIGNDFYYQTVVVGTCVAPTTTTVTTTTEAPTTTTAVTTTTKVVPTTLTAPPPTLPKTGSTSASMVVLAFASIIIGLGVMFGVRRRPRLN